MIAGFANEHVAHLWQLIESNAGKPVTKGQTADYAILPMNTVPEEKLQAKQLVSASLFQIVLYIDKCVVMLFQFSPHPLLF